LDGFFLALFFDDHKGMDFIIDELNEQDWEQVRSIYLEGIATGNATFETEAPVWEHWNISHLPFCRLVAREGERIKGWAALSPVSGRCVYAGVAETSVYVGDRYRGEGVGRALLEALVSASEKAGIWTLQAGVFPENGASLQLHERCGFRQVGRRERIGRMNGVWRDTLLLERRSEIVGTE
jgi:phosphinothricin acetyltransferase